jgi:hypothetical protein
MITTAWALFYCIYIKAWYLNCINNEDNYLVFYTIIIILIINRKDIIKNWKIYIRNNIIVLSDLLACILIFKVNLPESTTSQAIASSFLPLSHESSNTSYIVTRELGLCLTIDMNNALKSSAIANYLF